METVDCTVIIPTFKDGEKLIRSVNSVLKQTSRPKKIIIIDDFSQHVLSHKILNELSKNPLIEIIFANKNRGPGSARNLGINKSTTKYIAFLDADDSWHPQKLEVQIKVMEEQKYFLTCHNCTIQLLQSNYFPHYDSVRVRPLSKNELFIGNKIQTRSVLMRNTKEYLFKENKRYSEDFLLWLTIILHNEKVGIIEEDLGYYHKEDYTSGLSSRMEKMIHGEIENFVILKDNNLLTTYEKNFLVTYYFVKYIRRKIKYKGNKYIKRLMNYENKH